jgi:acyl-coenzyme A synthetase/AMP-(fatty) acid ligase
VNDNCNTLPTNTVGDICIQSRGSIDHYLNADESDQWVFKDGWFIPKDLGMLTSDGHLIFYGRSDNLMIFNGINIYPAEIENCLADHDCILDVIALPLSDPMHHQIPTAIVSLASPTTESELLHYCRKILGFRAPQRIFIVPMLNRNRQGKITQETLTQLIEEISEQN